MSDKLIDRDFTLILSYAENNMSRTKTAKALYLFPTSLDYRIDRIKRITGLNPKKFYDLVELVKLAKSDLNSCNRGETDG